MKLKHLFVSFLIVLIAVRISDAQERAQSFGEKPNILFLFADDQRTDTIAYYGNSAISTPNLDKIAQRGINYTNAYCMGSIHGAVCQPSRAMLHSGRTLYHVPMDLEGVVTLGELLGKNGYTTFGTGKWHNGKGSFARSFQHGKAIMFGGMSNHLKVPIEDMDSNQKFVDKRTGDKFSSELFANAAIEFLSGHNRSQPFFCYVSFTAPHDPRQPPKKFAEQYYKANLPMPKNFLPQHPFNMGSMQIRDEVLAGWPRTENVIRDQLAEYYGMITHMDVQIGRILESLERHDQRETIIVFAADHGLAMGSHGLLGKQNLYEHSMKAPLIIASTKQDLQNQNDSLVYLHDLYPTIAKYAKVKNVASDVEGNSLPGVFDGVPVKVRESLYTIYANKIRAVRDKRFKLIRWPLINKTQLFDLVADPDELHDLAGSAEHTDHVRRLTSVLEQWKNSVDDPHPLTVANPKPAEIDMTGKPRKPDSHQPEWIVEKYFK